MFRAARAHCDLQRVQSLANGACDRGLRQPVRHVWRPRRCAQVSLSDAGCAQAGRCVRVLLAAGVKRAELHASTKTHVQPNFRSWRDSGITWLAISGLGVDKIMRRAGHDTTQTTMGYVKLAEDLGGDLGAPFAPLPASLIDASSSSDGSQGPCEPPVNRARRQVCVLRIPLNLSARSAATWATVPVHLGARIGAQRRVDGQVDLFRWSLSRFPSSSASTDLAVQGDGHCARGGRRWNRRSWDRPASRATPWLAAAT